MMERRTFLGALASGGAAALAGCTSQRETISAVSTTTEIPSGEFYHRELRVDGQDTQFNLRYEVTADAPFDAMLFGGQSDPAEFDTYRQLVGHTEGGAHHAGGMGCGGPHGEGNQHHGGAGGAGSGQHNGDDGGAGSGQHNGDGGAGSGRHHGGDGDAGSGRHHGGDGSGGSGRLHGRGPGPRSRCPEPSDWHSVMGARGQGEVNKPLRPGIHHFVVDNTRFGEATPTGTLRPTIDLRVRDFDMFSG